MCGLTCPVCATLQDHLTRALAVAVVSGHVPVVGLLLEAGLEPNASLDNVRRVGAVRCCDHLLPGQCWGYRAAACTLRSQSAHQPWLVRAEEYLYLGCQGLALLLYDSPRSVAIKNRFMPHAQLVSHRLASRRYTLPPRRATWGWCRSSWPGVLVWTCWQRCVVTCGTCSSDQRA